MNARWFTFIFILLSCVSDSYSARILLIGPVASKSHKISMMPVVEALARRGHQVTIVTGNPAESSIKNVRDIFIHNPVRKDGEVDWFAFNSVHPLAMYWVIFNYFAKMSRKNYESMMGNAEFQSVLQNRDVDLVILNDSFNEFCLPVIEALGVPFVYFGASTGYPWVFHAMGASQELSSVPSRFTGYNNDMSFYERLVNSLAGVGAIVMRNWIVVPALDAYTRKDFPQSRSISEIAQDASLYFLSCNWASTWARPLPPTIIPLGAMHVRPAQPLPQDLVQFIEEGGEELGFIVFSLGSMKSSKFMPEKFIQMFVQVFSRIPQRVIWKWDDPDNKPSNVSPNVLLSSWLPQQDLLGHPNAALFITHGGLLGMHEAFYHAVPLLVLPFGTDQYLNAAKATKEGCALQLDWKDLDEESLRSAIESIISQSSFKANASRLSRLMKDELVRGEDLAVYWLEHVLRHNGTSHLKLSSQSLSFYQYYLLDVWLFLGIVLIAVTFGTFLLMKRIASCVLLALKGSPVHLKTN